MSLQRILYVLMGLLFALPAFAYLDPGSGSVLLQGLLAAFAGLLAAIKIYWQKFKAVLKRLFGKKSSISNHKHSNNDH